MLKVVSLNFQNTTVDFLFYRYDSDVVSYDKTKFHKHINFEIHFAINGSYEYELTDKKILLKKNQMLIIPPGVTHKAVDVSEKEYDFKILTLKISSEKTGGFYDFFTSAFQKRALESIEVQEELVNDVLSLYSAMDANSYMQSIHLNCCASMVIYALCKLLTEDKEKYPSEMDEHLEVQIENLVNNFTLSLTDIAKKINYSPRQTERLIKKIYGQSLTEIRGDFK